MKQERIDAMNILLTKRQKKRLHKLYGDNNVQTLHSIIDYALSMIEYRMKMPLNLGILDPNSEQRVRSIYFGGAK